MARGRRPLSRQALYVRKIRAELIAQLGAKCELCTVDDPDVLEFDHIHGRDYVVNQLSSSARMARYKREAEQGLLRLLCADCNLAVRKTNDNGQFIPSNAQIHKTPDIPF